MGAGVAFGAVLACATALTQGGILSSNSRSGTPSEIRSLTNQELVFADLGLRGIVDGDENPKTKTVVKREVKKPKNTKKRKKLGSKRKQDDHLESESEPESKLDVSKSEEPNTSENYDDSSSTDPVEDSVKSKESSSSDDKTGPTEEVSLTSDLEESDIIDSGPDSSPPASSDSTDESSASRAISGGSSEVSYTMSSSAEDAFPTSSSAKCDKQKQKDISYTMSSSLSVYSSSGESEESTEEDGSNKSNSKIGATRKEGSEEEKKLKAIDSKSANPLKGKMVTNKANKKEERKKMSENRVNHHKKKYSKQIKGKNLKPSNKIENKNLHRENKLEVKAKFSQISKDTAMNKNKLKELEHLPHYLQFTTDRVLNMAPLNIDTSIKKTPKVIITKEQPVMEMLKVKKAVDPHKREELEHDLNRDYPDNQTVEIVNWEGTFAPIVGEPYVAPVHHQPDSFWDAIYRSTDPDLPTPVGAGSKEETTLHPSIYLTNTDLYNMELKGKDKGKKEKKKPKLTPKEKKKKKREKQEGKFNMNSLIKPGKVKTAGNAINGHLKAAGRSEDTLKTPSEEERESGTTYKPEGAYEYPSFRHPNFNPDTAYDENGIPIHESPGWTQPPTLPGDRRFGKERSKAGAGMISRVAGKSENTLKTPSEEERESGTTYKPEGAYEYPSFRHPNFNPDTAYDENGIPIHESPGWTQPPTLPGDHRFGKERNRAEAGMISWIPVAATLARPLTYQSHDGDVFLHGHQNQNTFPKGHMDKNFMPQGHIDLGQGHIGSKSIDHKHKVDYPDQNGMHQGLMYQGHFSIGLNEGSAKGSSLLLPIHPGAVSKDNDFKHRIQKRKASSKTLESISSTSSQEVKNTNNHQLRQETENKAYELTDKELMNKEDSAPLEGLNPALYMHRNMMQVRKKTGKKPEKQISDDAEVIAVIMGHEGIKVPSKGIEVPSDMKLPPVHRIFNTQSKKDQKNDKYNEALNPLLYKHRNMLKVNDITADDMKISKKMIQQSNQANSHNKETIKAIPLQEYIKGANALRGRGRENFNPFFINNYKIFRVNTNKYNVNSVESHVVKREVKEQQKPKVKKGFELSGGTPGAGRPKNLRKKTKDDDDSFASYFEGVDPNVEEEDEWTPRPETTTMAFFEVDPAEFEPRKSNRTYQQGVRHTPSTLSPEPKHETWNKEFLSTNRLQIHAGNNRAAEPSVRRPLLLQESSVFYIDQDMKNNILKNSPNNRKQKKLTSQREKVIQTNARILHRLNREMRPKWKKQLNNFNLDFDNMNVNFTDSVQEEMKEVIEQQLLNSQPKEGTLDEITQKLFKMIEDKKKQNKSIGHIVIDIQPTKDPLIKGTVHIGPDKESVTYYLQYWPLDQLEKVPRTLNGTFKMKNLKVNFTCKNAARKILRSILTVRPRELSHAKANEVLNNIFTRATNADTITKLISKKPSNLKTPKDRGKKVKETDEISVRSLRNQRLYVDLPPDIMKELKEMGVETIETIKPMLSEPRFNKTAYKEMFMETKKIYGSKTFTTTPTVTEASSVFKQETRLTADNPEKYSAAMAVEFNKLQETIIKSRNISSILMKEMEEAKERKKATTSMEEVITTKSENQGLPVGGWNLQQRIREFKPGKPFPTIPPFVRRWPTFRIQTQNNETATPSTNKGGMVFYSTMRPTLLTMRPKYGGPRHEPFFFNDFKRIRTVYPTMSTETLQMVYEFGRSEKGLDSFETTTESTHRLEMTSIHPIPLTPNITKIFHVRSTEKYFSWPRFDWDKLDNKRRKFYKIGHEFRNETPCNSLESSTTFEHPVYYWDDVDEQRNEFYRVGGKYRHLYTTRQTTAVNNYEDDDSLFKPFDSNTTGKPYFVELKVSGKIHTVRPIYVRLTKPPPPTMPTTYLTTTRKLPHLHAIKHQVSKGLNKFLRIFGFGKDRIINDDKE